MKKRWWALLAILLLFFILVKAEPVSAAPPQQVFGGTSTGLDIQYPQYEYSAQNKGFTLHTHIFNLSNGLPVDNSTVDCYLHLYATNGSHLLKAEMGYEEPEFELFIDGGNFSNLGRHAYIIWCNGTGDGGYVSGNFLTTSSGNGLDYPQAILYAVSIFMFMIFIFVMIMTAKAIPQGNVTDELGQLVGINWWKHAKTILYGLVWVMVALGSFIMSNIAIAYLPDLLLQKVFFSIFTLMMILSVPMLIYWAIYLLVGIFRDREVNKLIYQGFEVGNGKKI